MKRMVFAIILFSLVVNAQGEKSAAKMFLEIKERSGLDVALTWLDSIDVQDQSLLWDENEFLPIAKEMRSFGDVEEAVRLLKSAVRFLPQSSAVWENLGSIQVRAQRKEDAIVSFRKVLEIDPKNRSAQGQLQMIDALLAETRDEIREKMRFKPGENTGIRGSYLGQKLPGLKPEVFAPGIVSVFGSNENTVTLSKDGKELYFGKESGIWVCRWEKEGWTAPENTGFPGYEMWISTWSGKMYYSGYEPGIWVMERSGSAWGEAQRLVMNGMFSTLTRDETLYTTVFAENGKPNIGRYANKEGKYGEPEIFGPEINTQNRFDAHPNISPDGSMLIFDSDRPEGKGLYVSFKAKDGSWSPARFLGKGFEGMCSTFSPDGKILFFMKNRDIFWVSAKVLDSFKKGMK